MATKFNEIFSGQQPRQVGEWPAKKKPWGCCWPQNILLQYLCFTARGV